MLSFALSLALTTSGSFEVSSEDIPSLEMLARLLVPDLPLDVVLEAMRRPPPGCREEVEAVLADLDAAVANGEDAGAYFDEVTSPWLHEASVMNCDGTWPTDFTGEPVEPAAFECSGKANSETKCFDVSCTCNSISDCANLHWFCTLAGGKEEGFTCSRRNC